MKLTEAVNLKQKPFLSIEIIPPRKGSKLENIFLPIEKLLPFNPLFINVTNHQISFTYQKIGEDIHKISHNKHAGTVGLASAIKQRYHVEPVPHLICGGVNCFQLENLLIDFQFLNFQNLFVVRGDPVSNNYVSNPEKDNFSYASEIVKQISDMNKGIFTYPIESANASDFCIGVAGYPEKHYEAMNLKKDLQFLKYKVDQGADYIITQIFFNFDYYRRFVEKAREIGITVPIIPGIKPVIRRKSLQRIPRDFYIDIPQEFVAAFEQARTEKEEFLAGTQYITSLVEKLIDYGVPAIHLFTMGKGRSSKALLENIKGLLRQ